MIPTPAAILLVEVAFFAFALVLPLVRLYRRTGVFGLVSSRGADPAQRFMGGAFFAALAALFAWPILLAALGPDALGVLPSPPLLTATGWALLLAGLLVVIVAQYQMGVSWRIGIDDRPTALVTDGLYAWTRNPIYLGILLLMAGLLALTPSAWTLLGLAHIYALVGLQMRLEEGHLRRLHGAAWDDYAARVGRLVPWAGRLHPSSASPA